MNDDNERSWSKEKQEVPLDKDGNQMHYPEYWRGGSKWMDNIVFKDVLTYVTYHRGRSAAYFEFMRKNTGTTVTFFMRDFQTIIPKLVKGKVTGTFTFCKQGANYGCRLVKS